MYSNTITFEQFVKQVDGLLFKTVGITTSDLVDFNIRDWFDEEMEIDDPELEGDIRDAAVEALEMSDAPVEVIDMIYQS
tara:strand:- start:52 stop:288 length:237 start_codon:yes stop_codon:yes gene_type:complete